MENKQKNYIKNYHPMVNFQKNLGMRVVRYFRDNFNEGNTGQGVIGITCDKLWNMSNKEFEKVFGINFNQIIDKKETKSDYVYVVFKKIKINADSDYDNDGFIIIDDTNEVLENCTVEKLLEYLKKERKDHYDSLIKKHKTEYLDLKDLNEIMNFIEKDTDGIMCLHYFQYTSLISRIHNSEKSAKQMVDYKNTKSKIKYYYSEYILQN